MTTLTDYRRVLQGKSFTSPHRNGHERIWLVDEIREDMTRLLSPDLRWVNWIATARLYEAFRQLEET